jgi:hypothetical protein
VDIDLQALPAQSGKAIQLELKTITPAGPGRHKVNVDLGQLWEYSQKPLARQPFYAFPRPHWDGELAAAARADGQDATELAVQRSKTGWQNPAMTTGPASLKIAGRWSTRRPGKAIPA